MSFFYLHFMAFNHTFILYKAVFIEFIQPSLSSQVFPSQNGPKPGGITDQQWFPVSPLVVMARTDGLMKCICKCAYTKGVERGHGVWANETHETPIWAGEDPDTLELLPG